MTFQEKADVLKWLVPMVFGQITLLVVAVIHAWASANRGKESREQNQRIETEVAEVKGTVATLTGSGSGGAGPAR